MIILGLFLVEGVFLLLETSQKCCWGKYYVVLGEGQGIDLLH